MAFVATWQNATGNPAPVAACQLLATSFGWWLQVFLGAACFVTLVGKRFTDRVRRPWKVWFFDTSKQGLSALVIHFVNILLSMAFGAWLDSNSDPCNWYWINLTLDDTLGIGILFILLRLLQRCYRLRCINRPDLALSGEYGDPPNLKVFIRQLLDWQALVVVEKCLLGYLVVSYTDHVAFIARALLGWLDPHPEAKLVVVMVVTPLTMNCFALWVADTFLQGRPKRPSQILARELDIGAARILGCNEEEWLQNDDPENMGAKANGHQSDDDRAAKPPWEEKVAFIGFQEWKRQSQKAV